jgi:hypothetical protein
MSSDDGSGVNRQAVRERIAEERAQWDALIAEVDPAWAEEPEAMGEWSFKDVAAHLAGWRQSFVDELVAAVQGTPVPALGWPFTHEESAEETPEGEARTQAINDWLYAQNRDRTYDQVLAQAALQWTTMQAVVDLMPDDLLESKEAFARLGGQPLAEAMLSPDMFSHFHEEHEPEIRAWLARRREGG